MRKMHTQGFSATLLALVFTTSSCSPTTEPAADAGAPAAVNTGGSGPGPSNSGGSAAGGSASGGATGGASGGASGGSTGTGGATGSGGGGGSSGVDSGASADVGEAPAGNAVTGMYGSVPIKPVLSGIWLGKPANADEAAGGPFVVLFSAPVTCADVSKSRGWIATIPGGTQVMELIIGTTEVGKELKEKDGAGAGMFESNYIFGMNKLIEHKASSGTLSLTGYVPGKAVDGRFDINFGIGGAKGTFHADWCPDGQEVGAP